MVGVYIYSIIPTHINSNYFGIYYLNKNKTLCPKKPPKSIRFPDDVQEAIEKKAKQRQRSFQWIVIEGMRKQLIDKKNKKV